MTSPTPCIEQRRFLESLGFEELKDHDTDYAVAWRFRSLRTKATSVIFLSPDEVPTAHEVLEHFGEALYRKGVEDTKRAVKDLFPGKQKSKCSVCQGTGYYWVGDPCYGQEHLTPCHFCK